MNLLNNSTGQRNSKIFKYHYPKQTSSYCNPFIFIAALFLFSSVTYSTSYAETTSRTLRADQSLSIKSHRCNLKIRSRSDSRVVVICSKEIENKFQVRPTKASYLTPKQKAIIKARACNLEVVREAKGLVRLKCNIPTSPTPTPTPVPPIPTPTPTPLPPTPSPTPSPTPVSDYTVGGTVSGLTGTVTIQNNSSDNLAISSDGSFTFATT